MRIMVPIVPASFFGMVIGLAGLGAAWRSAHQVWGRKRFRDLVPDASPPPTNEAIITCGAETICLWQIAPWRTRKQNPKMPLSTRRSFTRRTPRGLFGSIGLMAVHS